MSKFWIPCNWDVRLLDYLNNPKHGLYGKLSFDEIGGGRPSCKLPQRSQKFVRDYIKKARDKGLSFSYLLNSSCSGNKEFTKLGYRSIINLLGWIEDTGADYITVAIPYLAELIKSKFRRFKISVSKMAFVSTPEQAKFWQSLGTEEITLDPNINRDFTRFGQIRRSVKIDLILLANEACLLHCPYVYYHVNSDSHGSQDGGVDNYICYSRLFCEKIFLKEPSQMMKATFIRPEDLHHYEEIGIKKFKLVGRTRPTEWILNAARAYTKKSHNGNLADILGTFSSYNGSSDKEPHLLKLSCIDSLNALERLRKTNLLRPKIYIDNSKLDGFIDFFRKGNCDFSCKECNYCDKYAKKSVFINAAEKKSVLRNLNRLSNWIKNGELSRYYPDN